MEKSIYQIICENKNNGISGSNFSFDSDDAGTNGVKWAPGALDGVIMYHMQKNSLDPEAASLMAEAVRCASDGDFANADEKFAKLTKSHRALGLVDELQLHIGNNIKDLDVSNIFYTAIDLIKNSVHTECVKIGFCLLELYGFDDEELKTLVKDFAAYDEFALFTLWSIRKWDDRNDVIFDIAKTLRGWGRIHAVSYLKPETDEIRRWLLFEGTQNDVMNAYSALTCWKRSDAREVLFGEPSPEEYRALSILIDALLDEGPVHGISAIEDADEILERFLEISGNYELTEEELAVVDAVKNRLDNV